MAGMTPTTLKFMALGRAGQMMIKHIVSIAIPNIYPGGGRQLENRSIYFLGADIELWCRLSRK
jgi:hypothetical protein